MKNFENCFFKNQIPLKTFPMKSLFFHYKKVSYYMS